MRWSLLVLVACSEAPAIDTRFEVASFPAEPVSQLDLIFQMDDSGSTAHLQIDLANALGALLPLIDDVDLHIGVITSDLGTAGSLDPDRPGAPVGMVGQGGCAEYGKGGVMRTLGAPVNGTFVIHGEARNYDGTLQSVLDRMLRVGSTGCGFEQPLAATRRSLRVNEGFLRTDASLAIVIVADEDDCSIRDTALFTDDLGPLTSFRCTTQGVICDEPLTEVGMKSNCRPKIGSRYIEDPDITRSDLLFTKAQEKLTLSAIVGPPSPFEVELRAINSMSQLALAHSCRWSSSTGPLVADPPVRIASLVRSFASRGTLGTVCDSDYRPEVARIAMAIQRSLGIACIDPAGLDLETCTATDILDRSAINLPRCPSAGDCFDIVADPACTGMRVVVHRTSAPPARTRVDVRCASR